jgi:hypothetical protein
MYGMMCNYRFIHARQQPGTNNIIVHHISSSCTATPPKAVLQDMPGEPVCSYPICPPNVSDIKETVAKVEDEKVKKEDEKEDLGVCDGDMNRVAQICQRELDAYNITANRYFFSMV